MPEFARIPHREPWSVDRKVSLVFVLALMAQTAGGVWWAATLSGRVENHEKRIESFAPQDGRLIRVETKVDVIGRDIIELKELLRQRR